MRSRSLPRRKNPYDRFVCQMVHGRRTHEEIPQHVGGISPHVKSGPIVPANDRFTPP